jgi:hypothetical protein
MREMGKLPYGVYLFFESIQIQYAVFCFISFPFAPLVLD